MAVETSSITDLGLAVVAEFHRKFGIPQPLQPVLPKENVRDYLQQFVAGASKIANDLRSQAAERKSLQLVRLQLIQEELAELGEGMLNEDVVEVLDALVDLSYVLDGTYLTLGLADYKIPGLLEVHRSNMSKLGCDGEPIIADSGRVMKGPNYSPPDLRSLFK